MSEIITRYSITYEDEETIVEYVSVGCFCFNIYCCDDELILYEDGEVLERTTISGETKWLIKDLLDRVGTKLNETKI